MIKEIDVTSSNPFSRKIAYYIDEAPVAYLEYSLIYDRMELDNIKVFDDYRRQGIATKLLAHLISLAIEFRVENITLEVRVSNEIARHLYKKFGFREVALRKYYYADEDGILMEKQVM